MGVVDVAAGVVADGGADVGGKGVEILEKFLGGLFLEVGMGSEGLALQRLSSPPLPDFLIVWWGETDMTNSPTGENGCRKVLSYWLNRHYRLVNTSTNSHVQLMKRDLKAIP